MNTVVNLPGFKDGEGDGESQDLIQIIIDFAVNGYCVTYLFEDGTDMKQIYDDFDVMMKDIRSRH